MRKDRPWKPTYVHHAAPRTGPRPLRVGVVLVAIALIPVGFIATTSRPSGWTATPDPSSGAPTSSTPRSAPPASPESSDAPTSSVPVGPEDALPVEGVDYTVSRTGEGELIRWACDIPITIATSGEVPASTQEALHDAVGLLRAASGLPLAVQPPDSGAKITVYYAPLGVNRHGSVIEDADTLGVGSRRYSDSQIFSGTVIVRNDTTHTDPATDTGRTVLTHELLHTLGLGHAQQHTGQLMTPELDPNSVPVLGAGDRAGLAAVGC